MTGEPKGSLPLIVLRTLTTSSFSTFVPVLSPSAA